MNLKLNQGSWLNQPKEFQVTESSVSLATEPETDFWQRSYYGFRNDNAPAYLFESDENITFTVKADFQYKELFDQSGVVIYTDSDNWFKASIEYENKDFARLGSVVTNNGYSDWATTNIKPVNFIWYRLSRRGPDFLIESSFDGSNFSQMRIFHLHDLGTTTPEMGRMNPPLASDRSIRFGVYACSPTDSSFKAKFTDFQASCCLWRAHTPAET